MLLNEFIFVWILFQLIVLWFRKMRRFEDAYNGGATTQNILEQVEELKRVRKRHRTALRL